MAGMNLPRKNWLVWMKLNRGRKLIITLKNLGYPLPTLELSMNLLFKKIPLCVKIYPVMQVCGILALGNNSQVGEVCAGLMSYFMYLHHCTLTPSKWSRSKACNGFLRERIWQLPPTCEVAAAGLEGPIVKIVLGLPVRFPEGPIAKGTGIS